MGWSNQAVDLIILQEEQTGYSGLFGYSPAPGLGNLILSVAARAGTDPYGNVYPQGISSKFNVFSGGTISGAVIEGTSQIELSDSSGNVRLVIGGGSSTPYIQLENSYGAVLFLLSTKLRAQLWYADTGSATQGALIASLANESGIDNFGSHYPPGMTTYTGNAATDLFASFTGAGIVWGLNSDQPGGTSSLSFIGGGAVLNGHLMATDPVNGGAETWHSLGGSGIGSTGGYAMYRLTPENELQISIHLDGFSHTSNANYSFANALPAAYIPSYLGVSGWPMAFAPNTLDAAEHLTIASNGIVTMNNVPAGATAVGIDVRIPLSYS